MRPLALALLIVGVVAAPAAATPQDVANEISREVMSPFCKGVTLHDCPSQAAADLRRQIEQWAADGWSKPRIMDELEERYGPSIHAVPQDSAGTPAWLLPGIALALGLVGLAWLAPRWAKRSTTDGPPIDPIERARVEQELAALREELS